MGNMGFGTKLRYKHALRQLARFYGSEAIISELKRFREYNIISEEEQYARI